MSTEVRRLPVLFDHDGQEQVGDLNLPAGEYTGYSEELGIRLGEDIQWGRPEYHLMLTSVEINVTADVVMGRIAVREPQTEAEAEL